VWDLRTKTKPWFPPHLADIDGQKKNHGHGCTPGEEIDVHVRLGVRVVSPLSWDPMHSPIEFNAQSHHGSAQ
jgi:hypothetical protein